MLFQTLAHLAKSTTFNMLITEANGGQELSVTIIPTAKEGQSTELRRSLTLIAPPAELDEKFGEALKTWGVGRAALEEQLAAELEIQNAQKQQSTERTAKKLAGKPSKAAPVKPGAAPAAPASEIDDDDGSGRDGEATVDETPAANQTAPAAPAPQQDTAINLFA
jgi:PRTRC genetic system protein E